MLFVQKAHEEVLRGCVPDAPWVLDKQPARTVARGRATKVMYVDNFAVIAEAKGQVAQPGLEAMLGPELAWDRRCLGGPTAASG